MNSTRQRHIMEQLPSNYGLVMLPDAPTTPEIDYDLLAEKIAEKIQLQSLKVEQDDALWCGKKCADYLGISKSTFMQRTSKQPKFPISVSVPSTNGGGHLRWYAGEVKAYCRQHQG